ncbi:uncharacterized protein BYT42DRAFT_480517, partial [Radiomyces spectabilis]|uniref:uncharacterized protein n=1 Tax=Radiomyces spectabilis TaxID=64574 RepID=UPI00221F7A97
MRFFAAKALAGAILVDVTSNTAIMINTRKSIVALVWSTRITKVLSTKGVPAISTNPPVNSRVQEHLGVSIQSDEGTNWNIGTKSFNDLVMSSIHSHTKRAPELGPSAGKSVISEERGRHVQIFLNRADYQDAEKIALDEQAASILDFDILQQLRRVRSKFKQFSAYIPSRASSSLCDFHRLEPQTVFTYSSFENGAPDGDGRRAPRLFAHVAHEVI